MNNEVIRRRLRREIVALYDQARQFFVQQRVNDLRKSLGAPPQPVAPIREEDFQIPINPGGERE